jgi:hypothetical protein
MPLLLNLDRPQHLTSGGTSQVMTSRGPFHNIGLVPLKLLPRNGHGGLKGNRKMNIRSYQNPLQKQVRDMPEPPPIQGDSWLDTLHRGIRALAPDAYRTGYRLLNGQYQGNPVLSAGADMNRVENWSPDPFPGGSAALGAVAGGLVNMGKKTYPNAFLHRAIGHEKELGHWNDIFQRGISTQKPTSAITPSNPTTFMNRNAGLLFNALIRSLSNGLLPRMQHQGLSFSLYPEEAPQNGGSPVGENYAPRLK